MTPIVLSPMPHIIAIDKDSLSINAASKAVDQGDREPSNKVQVEPSLLTA